MIGPTLAHYRITAKLGEGGMGAVYRATDTKLNRDVAIKVLPDAFASDTDRLARFTREAQVLASLNHPNIAAIYGVEERAIIMELVEGQELKGPLDLDTALAYAAQIADALDAAHEKGITHRDLKPANIKVTPQGTIKVLDFGLAKIAEPQQPASTATSPTLTIRATEAGLIMGTASYMSPEQARGQAVDKRADIWAFGVILWELLTGRQMFEGDTVSDVLASVLKSSPDLEAVPPKVRRLLARCLEKDSRKRLRDISVWRELLVEAAPPDTTAAPAHARRNWILPGIAVCGVLCGFLLAEWLRPPQPSPAAPVARFSLPPAHLSARVSPDGRWLVYPDPDQAALRVRSLEETASRTLSGTDGANIRTLFWSEDSQAFGCVMGGRLRLVALDGGRVVELGSVSDFRGGTWRGGLANGRIVAAIGRKLRTIELPTREAHDLPLPFREDEVPKGPQFLPEGNAFVYILESKDEKIRLVRSSLGSNAIERLFDTSGAVEFARHPHSGQWYCLFG